MTFRILFSWELRDKVRAVVSMPRITVHGGTGVGACEGYSRLQAFPSRMGFCSV